jgi:hypothetical protein
MSNTTIGSSDGTQYASEFEYVASQLDLPPPTARITVRPVSGVTPEGQIEAGNIDLTNRPIVPTEGGYATVRSMNTNIDGQEVLLPTVSTEGKIMTPDESIDHYLRTGQHLGKFDTPQNAQQYGQQLHLDQEKLYGPKIQELQQRGPIPIPPQRPSEQPQSFLDLMNQEPSVEPASMKKPFTTMDIGGRRIEFGGGGSGVLPFRGKPANVNIDKGTGFYRNTGKPGEPEYTLSFGNQTKKFDTIPETIQWAKENGVTINQNLLQRNPTKYEESVLQQSLDQSQSKFNESFKNLMKMQWETYTGKVIHDPRLPEDYYIKKAGDIFEIYKKGNPTKIIESGRSLDNVIDAFNGYRSPAKQSGDVYNASGLPTTEEAQFARESGFGYGKEYEQFLNNEIARITGTAYPVYRYPVQPPNKDSRRFPAQGPPEKIGESFTATTPATVDEARKLTSEALNRPSITDPYYLEQVKDEFMRAAIVVNKIPIAALGFDPNKTALAIGKSAMGSIGLTFPESGNMYANTPSGGPSTIVHESIHKGLEILEKTPEGAKLISKLPFGGTGNETVVRWLMMSTPHGDLELPKGTSESNPERGTAAEQREAARIHFSTGLNQEVVKEKLDTLNKLQDLAAKLLAKKRPGGPR